MDDRNRIFLNDEKRLEDFKKRQKISEILIVLNIHYAQRIIFGLLQKT